MTGLDILITLLLILILSILVFSLRKRFDLTEIRPPWLKFSLKQQNSVPHIVHNLPNPDYEKFIGRTEEIEKINRLLLPYPKSQIALISIDGLGGVGKSALALEVSLNITRSPKPDFEAVIWVSAKGSILLGTGIHPRKHPALTIMEILTTISIVLGFSEEYERSKQEQRIALVRKHLAEKRTLLIVDNLETIIDPLTTSFLQEIPAPSKVIVTTRERIDVSYPIRLSGLEKKDALTLIDNELETQQIVLEDVQKDLLIKRTGGIPLAITWTIARIALGFQPEAVFSDLGNADSDISKFCFKQIIYELRTTKAIWALAALALSEHDLTRDRIAHLASMTTQDREENLALLERLSLVNRSGAVYSLLPLTKQYLLQWLQESDEIRKEILQRISKVSLYETINADSIFSRNTSYSIQVPIGRDPDDKIVELIIDDSSPHVLITGISGVGKTVCLQTLVRMITLLYSEEEIRILLLDMKGSSEYRALEKVNGVTLLASGEFDHDSVLRAFEELLDFLENEIAERQGTLHKSGASNFTELRKDSNLPRVLVIIDEFSVNDSEILFRLQRLVRSGRAFGIHFIFSTLDSRYIDREIEQNVSTTLIFRSLEPYQGINCMHLPTGSCVLRTANHFIETSIAYIDEADIQRIAALIRSHT